MSCSQASELVRQSTKPTSIRCERELRLPATVGLEEFYARAQSDPDGGHVQLGRWVAGRAAMGHTRTYTNKMELAAMTPQDDLASTKYCLAEPGNLHAEANIRSHPLSLCW